MKKNVKVFSIVLLLFSVITGMVCAADTASDLAKAWAPEDFPGFSAEISIIRSVPGNHAKVYVGCTNGNIYVTDNAYNPEPFWTRLLPNGMDSGEGRSVTGIAVNPYNNAEIYFVFNNIISGGKLLKTEDCGNTFSTLAIPDYDILNISIDPVNPDILYLAARENLYLSMDKGITWQENTTENTLNIPLVDQDRISVIEQLAQNPDMVFAGTEKGDLFVCSYIRAVQPYWYRITAGQTLFTGKTITSIAVDTRSVMPVIYLSIEREYKDLFLSGGIFKSINGGTEWESIHNPGLPLYVPVHHISIHPYYADFLYASFGFSGSAFSADKGVSWELSLFW